MKCAHCYGSSDVAARRLAIELNYGLLVTVHLVCAIVFGGAVAFEVLILPALQKQIPSATLKSIERILEARAVKILPFVLIALYLSGMLMLLRHFPDIGTILSVSMGRWLAVKIGLATIVLMAVATALTWLRLNRMTPRRMRAVHLLVFACVLGIAVIAKAMFYA